MVIDKSSSTLSNDIIKILDDDNISQTSRVNILFLAAISLLDGLHKISLMTALGANLVNKGTNQGELDPFIKSLLEK